MDEREEKRQWGVEGEMDGREEKRQWGVEG